MDSCAYQLPHHQYDCLVAAGSLESVSGHSEPFTTVDSFLQKGKWCFGHLGYELKNSFYTLEPKPDPVGFADFSFFTPQHLLFIQDNYLHIESEDPEAVYQAIIQSVDTENDPRVEAVPFQQRLSRSEYISKIQQLQQHLHRGDCYEINFCQEFFAESVDVDPLTIFQQLIKISPNPFSVLYRNEEQFLLCASPERFIKKTNRTIISQPIKGTARRDLTNAAHDQELSGELYNSPKERSENVMVVDLVRNDLARVCQRNSVEVEELFGIYSFPQVHQMISTIKGQIRQDIAFSKLIEALFPMGSMTGAPKYRVLQLIDQYEPVARGIFSGSVGYIDPEGDFDFNVVIRSLMYNQSSGYLSYQVGSGITIYSDPEKEWEECLLKAEAINQLFAKPVNSKA